MAEDDRVIIKGVRTGLLLLLDDSAEWAPLLDDLRARLAARRSFFQGAAVTANLGARIIDEPEFAGLQTVLAGYEMTLEMIVSTATQTRAVAGGHAVRARLPAFAAAAADPAEGAPRRAARSLRALEADPPALTPDGEPDFAALAGDDVDLDLEPAWSGDLPAALFVRRTLRSGMSIQHDGDVCILGDVNAGAEVVAAGDVVVWGALRGMVQAGAGGDAAAVVCALLLAPTQIRIADVVSRGTAPAALVAPEMARVVHGRILVEPWTGRRRPE